MIFRRLKSALVLPLIGLLFVAQLAWAQSDPVRKLALLGEAGTVRFQVDAGLGVITHGSLIDNGYGLRVHLKGATQPMLEQLVARLTELHPLVKSLQISVDEEAGEGVVTLVLLEQMSVLDETLVALDGELSRWEVVLSTEMPEETLALDEKLPTPTLHRVKLMNRSGLLQVVLEGNAAIVAEASFRANPPRLVLDLPKVPVKQLLTAIKRYNANPDNPLVRKIRGKQDEPGIGRLVFDLNQPLDLVESHGNVAGDRGTIVVGLVPDGGSSGPNLSQSGAVSGALKSVELRQQGRRLSLFLNGTSGTEVSAYALQNPPRIRMDLIGWKPEQVVDAVAAYQTKHPLIRAIRYGESRLGSARVEFELVQSVQMLDAAVRKSFDNLHENFVVSVLTPKDLLPGTALADLPLDRRLVPAHDFAENPEIMISPVQLFGKEQVMEAMDLEEAPAPEEPGMTFNLMDFFENALNHDAQFQGAKALFRSKQEAFPQALAGYLPSASFSVSTSIVSSDIKRQQLSSSPTGPTNYTDRNYSLTITQPLIQLPLIVQMSQARASQSQAKVDLLREEQELILRVAENYMNLLASKDALDMAKAEHEATQKHLERAQTQENSGLATRTDVATAEGRAALTEAEVIGSQNRLEDAKYALKEIVGDKVDAVHGFQGDFDPAPPQPANIESWLEAALKQNLTLQSARLAQRVQNFEVKRLKAGYFPTLELSGEHSLSTASGSIFGSGGKTYDTTIGVTMDMNLLEGGLTMSQVREARALEAQARHLADLEFRRVERQTRFAYRQVESSSRLLGALRKQVIANATTLQSKLAGFESGVADVLSVLDAYKLYYTSRREYLSQRYEYLINRLRLKQAVGALSRDDLETLAALLDS
ncbi:TolC family outer membrane protein [Magnetococcus sp. PR-3]|uniref:TolC family outer membrane protein n=1 Tax=Magnetococcus sp. PR-3 TaxID=3120355 RepID=UPI002FCE1157